MNNRDKLNEAFRRMRASGLVARQKFTCCQSCGVAEMESDRKEKKALTAKTGYVFYHRQDFDGMSHDGTVYLSFGAFAKDSEELDAEIGRTVVRCLRESGLDAEWDGNVKKRIRAVVDPELRKRVAN